MMAEAFQNWMIDAKCLKVHSARAHIKNCQRVEAMRHVDLDACYDEDRCNTLKAWLFFAEKEMLLKSVDMYVKFRDANQSSDFLSAPSPVPDLSVHENFDLDSSVCEEEDSELRAELEKQGLKPKAIDGRVRLASKVREILGRTLGEATRTDFDMAVSLRVLDGSPKEHHGNLQNVLRKFYKLVHGREFPRKILECDGALRISGRYRWGELFRIFKEHGIQLEKPKDPTKVSSVLGRSGLVSCAGDDSVDEKIVGFFFFAGSYDASKDEYSLVQDFIPIREPSLRKTLEECVRKSHMDGVAIYNSAKISKQAFHGIMTERNNPSKIMLMRLILSMSLEWKDAVKLLRVAHYPLDTKYNKIDHAFKYCYDHGIRAPRDVREIFMIAGADDYSLQGPVGDEDGIMRKKRKPLKMRTAEEARREAVRLDALRAKRQIPLADL